MQAIISHIWINWHFSIKSFKKRFQLKTFPSPIILGYFFSYKTFLDLKASILTDFDIIRQVYMRTKEFVSNTVAKDFSARYQISYVTDVGNSRNRKQQNIIFMYM
jgi:hypothetical protein